MSGDAALVRSVPAKRSGARGQPEPKKPRPPEKLARDRERHRHVGFQGRLEKPAAHCNWMRFLPSAKRRGR